jgi:hypothetical protein
VTDDNHHQTKTLSVRERRLLVGLGAFLLAMLAAAAWLQPDPRGFGTHQQLGLPPCTFQALFGNR